ncbi:phosphatase PAP2 family protein [Burkholderia sp. Nafp2/4-1b]|uniref:phosphatase PAP2 family protein n=1 Tax=Burkholderia sp. Nafp2/4-1b TaxID=2116686 RepID=UPI0013CF06B0|nr:phosphatase PAP2 family protein [Burkholderia sp. Nafp2/4-1b]
MLLVVFAVTGVSWLASRRSYKLPARKAFYGNVARSFQWIALMAVFTHAGTLLQYLAVATDRPLVSDALISFDAALGFHWLQAYEWVAAHPGLHAMFEFAYASGSVQLFAIPIILTLTSNSNDYAEFAVQFIVAVIVSILIAGWLPTESAFLHFDTRDPATIATVSDYLPLRGGAARELVFASAQGLISFPSLHTILALCFAYSLRHVRVAFPVALALNAMMIVSTPTQGGHYLCDVLAGLVIGVGLIYGVRKWFAVQRAAARAASGDEVEGGQEGLVNS